MNRILVFSLLLLAVVAAAPTASASHQCTYLEPGYVGPVTFQFYGGDCVGGEFDLGCDKPWCEAKVLVPLH